MDAFCSPFSVSPDELLPFKSLAEDEANGRLCVLGLRPELTPRSTETGLRSFDRTDEEHGMLTAAV
jgi:hypothetical protein